MCSIWKEKTKNFLSVEDIKRILALSKNPVSIALTGGEPFLHPGFQDIYKMLFLDYLKKKVIDIDISTNAASIMLPRFLKKNQTILSPLSLSISLDGLEKAHDLQRGVNGAFKKTLYNIMYARRFSVPVSIKFTITLLNYKDALKVYRLSKKLGCEFLIKLAEKNPHYYNRDENIKHFVIQRLNLGARNELKNELLKILSTERRDSKNTSTLAQFAIVNTLKFLRSGNMNFIKRCDVPKNCLFITSAGKIYSCIYYAPIGDTNKGKINLDKNDKIILKASRGTCRKCLAFHGFLNEINISYKTS